MFNLIIDMIGLDWLYQNVGWATRLPHFSLILLSLSLRDFNPLKLLRSTERKMKELWKWNMSVDHQFVLEVTDVFLVFDFLLFVLLCFTLTYRRAEFWVNMDTVRNTELTYMGINSCTWILIILIKTGKTTKGGNQSKIITPILANN